MLQQKKNSSLNSWQYGILSGVVIIAFYAYLSSQDLAILAKWFNLLAVFAVIFFMVLCGINYLRSQKKLVDFRSIVQRVFPVLVTSLLVTILFQYLLFNYINPSLPGELENIALEQMKLEMQQEGFSHQEMQRHINKAKSGEFQLGLFQSFQFFVFGLLPGFLLTALVSFLLKLASPFLVQKSKELRPVQEPTVQIEN